MKICTDSSEIRTMALQRLTTPFESSVTKITISEPAPTNHYNYEWSLISGPSMENAGSMENRQNQTLSLNDLQEGVYQFKVIVSGGNPSVHGEGFGNVTVLPRKYNFLSIYRTNHIYL